MSQKVFSKDAEPTNVEQIDILSNIDPSKSASVIGGFAGMTYTESIMSDTIKVNVSFIDSIGDFVIMARQQSGDDTLTFVPTEDVVISISASSMTINMADAVNFIEQDFLVVG